MTRFDARARRCLTDPWGLVAPRQDQWRRWCLRGRWNLEGMNFRGLYWKFNWELDYCWVISSWDEKLEFSWDLNGILIGIRYVMCDLFKTSGGWLARALTNQFFKGGFLLFLNRTQVWVRFFEIQLEAATWWVEFHHDLLPTINLGYGMISHDITMQPATNGDMHVYYELLHHHDKHNVWLIKKW